MARIEISLARLPGLPPGGAAFSDLDPGPGPHSLRLGSCTASVTVQDAGAGGGTGVAGDVWEHLALPYAGIRLNLRSPAPGQWELGPAVAVLYRGDIKSMPAGVAAGRADLYYGHLRHLPGLLAIGFEGAIDWDAGLMEGYVVDNRPETPGGVVRACFPIPDAVRLTWSHRRDVIARLRERTGNRTFNWARNLSKWRFHRLLSAVPELAAYLPETRLWRGPADLAVMLARYGECFVKYVYGIQGQAAARVRRLSDGFAVSHMDRRRPVETRLTDLVSLGAHLRQVVGRGPAVVQQGIPVTGRQGRALDFRVVVVRAPDGGWRCPVATANLAPDAATVFTNVANGATDEDVRESLQVHLGMDPDAARACAADMISLCSQAAGVLAGPLHPLGILGFDVAVAADSHRLWLLEANPVPGWGYPDDVEADLARSQTDFALLLAGFPQT